MKKNKINRNCFYYNLGGEGTKERPSYPSIYGARCEYYNNFFYEDNKGKLRPNCNKCKNIKEKLD